MAEERQRVLRHVWEKRAIIRHLNDRDAEIVFPNRGENEGNIRSLSFQLNHRLGDIHRDTERWRFVGCELCFVTTGQRYPDYGLGECNRWGGCEAVRYILRWLESLAIPKYYDYQR